MRKKILFLIFILSVILFFHFFDHERYVVTETEIIPYGCYGMAFSKMPPKTRPRVILLGNSVLQYTWERYSIVQLKDSAHLDLELGNFSITGASIADYIANYNYVKQFHPDLLVVHLTSITFGFTDPLYRNQTRKLLFLPEMRDMWTPLILNTYTKEDLVESFYFSYFPMFRKIKILREEPREWIDKYSMKYFGFRIMNFFPYSLNEGGEWHERNRARASAGNQYPLARPLFEFFVRQLIKDHQKAVFVIQESQDPDVPIFSEIESILADQPDLFSFYNFKNYYKKKDFGDTIHPNAAGSYICAQRLLRVIIRGLDGETL